MNSSETEGVIKYRLDYRRTAPSDYPQYAELNAWRTILFRLGLIGQDALRYGGLGFGNLSFRPDSSTRFVITGSQTGGLSRLTAEHYSTVLSADPSRNHIMAEGAAKPSSEALTHAAVYAADGRIKAVVHVHSLDIWRHHQQLALPFTAPDIRYGTPAMAEAVSGLFARKILDENPVFAMLGHQDGIVAFGASIAEASQVLIRMLALALQFPC